MFFHCQAEDAIARVLAMDEANLPALMLHALQGLTQSGQVPLNHFTDGTLTRLELQKRGCFSEGGSAYHRVPNGCTFPAYRQSRTMNGR